MNNDERDLIRNVCDGNMRLARMQVRRILEKISSKRDIEFRDDMLRRMEARKGFMELPSNIKEFLEVEDSVAFPKAKFLIRKTEAEVVEKIMCFYRAGERLADMGIHYLPSLMLHGESGCGKTELARYIAHRAELPFAYVRFSSIVDSHLGGTQSNIAKIFEYVSTNPCVLCFDEIDAIGMARGQEHELGEMNRIVIALMQELDRTHNNVIIIGTTNRFDRIDPALVRRFQLNYELFPLSTCEAKELSRMFFQYAGVIYDSWIDSWCEKVFDRDIPASFAVKACTDVIVNYVLKEEGERNETNL